MNLPDYERCVDFRRLHIEMGILKIPNVPAIALEEAVALQKVRELPDPEDAATDMRLHREAIPVWKQEVTDLPNAPLLLRGRAVCVYIRDQHDSVAFGGTWQRYAYHLFNCRALQRVTTQNGRADLLATRRSDGVFEVHSGSQKALSRLELCADCREILTEQDWQTHSFDLSGFLATYDVYEQRKLREVAPVLEAVEGLDLPDACRRACQFRCQACDVMCTDLPGLLHLHYEDGDPTHTDAENLRLLCVDCHASLPGHDHMKMQPVVQADIEVVNGLRKEQRIISLGV